MSNNLPTLRKLLGTDCLLKWVCLQRTTALESEELTSLLLLSLSLVALERRLFLSIFGNTVMADKEVFVFCAFLFPWAVCWCCDPVPGAPGEVDVRLCGP